MRGPALLCAVGMLAGAVQPEGDHPRHTLRDRYTCFSGTRSACVVACLADVACEAWLLTPGRAQEGECCLLRGATRVDGGASGNLSGIVSASDRLRWRKGAPPLPTAGGAAAARNASGAGEVTADGTSWDLVVILPVHPPKWPWLCNYLDAAVGRSLPTFVVFSSPGEQTRFADGCPCRARLAQSGTYSLVSPRWRRASNLPTLKKWWAINHVFATTPALRALALDSDTQPIGAVAGFGARLREYLQQRDVQQTVMMQQMTEANAEEKVFATITRLSCRAAKLPSLAGYAWWSDAPVYDREDWPDFFGRTGLSSTVARQPKVFDWLSYVCYKVYVRRWATRTVPLFLEEAHCDEQRSKARGHAFGWSTGNNSACGGKRLFQSHLDRRLQRGEQARALRLENFRIATSKSRLDAYCRQA
ncbi:hypothetical protein T492DRAFT_1000088 [Pavlovales sp. CCMP2436]|nr:hypothetical protein T492DRAFT_1000088 [Pavlovales sp. CCMP2436]|mmetsp:Transcript_25717/g.65255  ORF Transcript_25717/g.65255 Transcript_25717/m.65255 type:complete len:418 (+) Transcript_25717:46-1299(+)